MSVDYRKGELKLCHLIYRTKNQPRCVRKGMWFIIVTSANVILKYATSSILNIPYYGKKKLLQI